MKGRHSRRDTRPFGPWRKRDLPSGATGVVPLLPLVGIAIGNETLTSALIVCSVGAVCVLALMVGASKRELRSRETAAILAPLVFYLCYSLLTYHALVAKPLSVEARRFAQLGIVVILTVVLQSVIFSTAVIVTQFVGLTLALVPLVVATLKSHEMYLYSTEVYQAYVTTSGITKNILGMLLVLWVIEADRLKRWHLLRREIFLAILATSVASIWFLQARGALAGLGLYFLSCWISRIVHSRKGASVAFVFGFIAVVLAATFLLPAALENLGYGQEKGLAARLYVWRAVAPKIAHSPWFGHGFGQGLASLVGGAPILLFHNTFLTVLYEGGAVALAAVVAWLGALVYVRLKDRLDFDATVPAIVISTAAMNLFENTLLFGIFAIGLLQLFLMTARVARE